MIDIVIVNYKSTDYLETCLSSIGRALEGVKANIFVEDNDSDDRIHRIESAFPQVFLNRNSKNLGFAKAVNQGARRGEAPYLILLNPDAIVKEGFFRPLIAFLEEHPRIGVIGPKILEKDGSVQNSARSFPNPLTGLFGRTSVLTRCFPENRWSRKNLLSLDSDGKTPLEVDWVSGACMAVRRKAFEEVGPLDERFFMYWEDADWCKRMRQNGWKVVYFPLATITHLGGGSSDRLACRSIFEFHKSSYLYYDKHGRSWSGIVKPAVIGCLVVRLVCVLCGKGLARAVKLKGQPGKRTGQ
jgi:GT2 family glycosyltransferase